MPATVAEVMPSAQEIAACRWLPESELAVYAAEYQRTGFQGGLNWYRSRTSGHFDIGVAGVCGTDNRRSVDVHRGKSDWGAYQQPGRVERMQQSVCTQMLGCHLIEGAGHWVQQEQPEAVSALLIDFLRGPAAR